jgi:AI-2 transport protein TqsA
MYRTSARWSPAFRRPCSLSWKAASAGDLLAGGGLLAIDQYIGNYLDPRLLGRTLNISSLVVLISVIFWGWIWGVIGTLLAVPMTATIMIACDHVPALRPIAIFMSGGGGESEHA